MKALNAPNFSELGTYGKKRISCGLFRFQMSVFTKLCKYVSQLYEKRSIRANLIKTAVVCFSEGTNRKQVKWGL